MKTEKAASTGSHKGRRRRLKGETSNNGKGFREKEAVVRSHKDKVLNRTPALGVESELEDLSRAGGFSRWCHLS
ncbi:hypothetical protein E2542_SST08133 [Spatholobus suberectus]|nr:hypothetical protein E2542_SST08133 [Spatholobus suberectus]